MQVAISDFGDDCLTTKKHYKAKVAIMSRSNTPFKVLLFLFTSLLLYTLHILNTLQTWANYTTDVEPD